MHPLNKYLFRAYYVSWADPGAKETSTNRKDKDPALSDLTFWFRENHITQVNGELVTSHQRGRCLSELILLEEAILEDN